MKATTAMLALYRALTGLGQPLAGHLLTTRARRGKEDPARLTERLGEASRLRPPGALVWIHGVSVGESLSSLPLVEALLTRRPNLTILVTCATLTAAQLLSERLPKGVIHQFVPIDTPQATGAFMRHWQPDLAVLVEGELWPNLITAAKASGARLALISARMTQKSARGWHGLARSAKALLGQFDLILAQDQDSKARLEALGANVAGLANLKTLALPLAYSAADLGHLRGQIGQRPVLLAASTHLGEDEIVLRAFKALTVWPDQPKPLLILAPRHPVRGADLEQTVADLGFSAARRSISQPIAPTTEVYIADTLGEMGLFYRLATLTIMGGSLVSGIGGHNP